MKDTTDQFASLSADLAADPVQALAYLASRPEDYDELNQVLVKPGIRDNLHLQHTVDDVTGIVTHTATGRPCVNMACFKAFILARYW